MISMVCNADLRGPSAEVKKEAASFGGDECRVSLSQSLLAAVATSLFSVSLNFCVGGFL